MYRNSSFKHGYFGTPIYNRWAGMKSRCHNPNDKNFSSYGSRGITVCDRWRDSFENFLADMGDVPFPKAQIDRIDNNKGYSPSNCRWATPKENSQNTRETILLTHNGVTLSLIDWPAKVGIKYTTLHYRYKQGWPVERIFAEPVRHKDQGYRNKLAEQHV